MSSQLPASSALTWHIWMFESASVAVAVIVIICVLTGLAGECETETVGGVVSVGEETVKTYDNGALICEALSVQFM